MRPSATRQELSGHRDMVINRHRSAGAINVRFGAHYGLKSDIAPSALRVIRFEFVMSAVCPIYTEHRTFPTPVGTSQLDQELTF
jgi:hypothetical protein